MWKRLARKPSTPSLMPAARNRKKAIRIPPEVIAQTTIGTSRIRPKVMRFGILKRGPGSGSYSSCCPQRNIPAPARLHTRRFRRRRRQRSRPARAAINHLSGLVAFVDKAHYAAAGVDIDAGNRMVELIKPLVRKTARAGADAEIGGLGGFFRLKAGRITDPILVAANDGVGTKVKIAIETGRHDTIGIDLVAMSVNDLVVQGAEPLFFLDYFACAKLDPDIGAKVVTGIAAACRETNCALIGGETAEMPGVYHGDDYDLAGFAVGAVSRAELLPRADIAPGDVVVGLASTGVHSNGFSLVRRIAADAGLTWDKAAPFEPSRSLGEALLTPTRLYVRSCLSAIRETKAVKALAHITGGGFTDNSPRGVPPGL